MCCACSIIFETIALGQVLSFQFGYMLRFCHYF